MKKIDIKSLTKKQKILIAVSAVVLVAIVALSIALPLTLGGDKVPEISFAQFDRLSDCSVKIDWGSILGAKKYNVEYCYGTISEDGTKRLSTEQNFVTVTRQTGILSVRVQADDGKFSEWKSIDIPALRLKAPTNLDFSSDMKVSWNPVVFDYFGKRTPVSMYIFEISAEAPGLQREETVFPPRSTTTNDLYAYIKQKVGSLNGEDLDWINVTFTARVKAVVDPLFIGSETKEEEYLKKAYVESEYSSASIIITKEIYEGMRQL